MLTDSDVRRLLDLVKRFIDPRTIDFPSFGTCLSREAVSIDGHEAFMIDINRKGRVKVTKCTFQERYAVTDILLRLDIDGPPHVNPDGTDVPCPHLHVYKEGFADKWAFPLDATQFTDCTKLVRTFREFLALCGIDSIPPIQDVMA